MDRTEIDWAPIPVASWRTALMEKMAHFELRLPYLGHRCTGPERKTQCASAGKDAICGTCFASAPETSGRKVCKETQIFRPWLAQLCIAYELICIWADQMQTVFQFRFYIHVYQDLPSNASQAWVSQLTNLLCSLQAMTSFLSYLLAHFWVVLLREHVRS